MVGHDADAVARLEPSRAGEKQMYVADPVASGERGDHVLVEAVCADSPIT